RLSSHDCGSLEWVKRPRTTLEFRRALRRADRHRRLGERPRPPGRSGAEVGALQLPALDPECVLGCREFPGREPEADPAAGRAGKTRGRTPGLRTALNAAVQRGLYVVYDGAAGGAVAVSPGPHAPEHPPPGLQLAR